jgi:hypothetical protein
LSLTKFGGGGGKGRTEGEERREPSAKKQDVLRFLRLSVATRIISSPEMVYRFGLFLD